MQFEWTKYKRVFAFGCSFTGYTYPTWADLIMYQTPQADLYNFGVPGMGNLAIASRIAEANTRFNFNEHDLIMVMYSTMFREDRWIENRWRAHGNIYNQKFYDKNFVKNYVDPIGCIIRDLAMIELSTNYIKNLPCDSLLLKSASIDDECNFLRENNAELVDSVLSVYNELWDSFPLSIGETLFPDGWVSRSTRIHDGKPYDDSHPITGDYYQYLKILGLNLSVDTEEFAMECDRKIATFADGADWTVQFPELFKMYHKNSGVLV